MRTTAASPSLTLTFCMMKNSWSYVTTRISFSSQPYADGGYTDFHLFSISSNFLRSKQYATVGYCTVLMWISPWITTVFKASLTSPYWPVIVQRCVTVTRKQSLFCCEQKQFQKLLIKMFLTASSLRMLNRWSHDPIVTIFIIKSYQVDMMKLWKTKVMVNQKNHRSETAWESSVSAVQFFVFAFFGVPLSGLYQGRKGIEFNLVTHEPHQDLGLNANDVDIEFFLIIG